ncbi:MAG TPA: nitrilase-related carbon-nitrogen hydrolase, partial [Ornithinibacter sp.]|nr:nitrilase-related carbon-nitrogen hydrolase [Ornithinibacter sp.]
MRLITAASVPPSLARVTEPTAPPLRVGLVQHAWDPDADALRATLTDGIRTAADAGAQIVFLPELTLSRYPADTLPTGRPDTTAESLTDGPTITFAREAAAATGVLVHASLFERAPAPDVTDDGLGFNTAILVAPDG